MLRRSSSATMTVALAPAAPASSTTQPRTVRPAATSITPTSSTSPAASVSAGQLHPREVGAGDDQLEATGAQVMEREVAVVGGDQGRLEGAAPFGAGRRTGAPPRVTTPRIVAPASRTSRTSRWPGAWSGASSGRFQLDRLDPGQPANSRYVGAASGPTVHRPDASVRAMRSSRRKMFGGLGNAPTSTPATGVPASSTTMPDIIASARTSFRSVTLS